MGAALAVPAAPAIPATAPDEEAPAPAAATSSAAAPAGPGAAPTLSVDDEPPLLLCPITQQLFFDPVVNATGQTYERAALLSYWAHARAQGGQRRDPLTNTAVSAVIVPNWLARSQARLCV